MLYLNPPIMFVPNMKASQNLLKQGLFLLLTFCFSTFNGYGQTGDSDEVSKVAGAWWLGYHISTRGMGGSINFTRGDDEYQLLYGIDFFSTRASREAKVESAFGSDGRKFVYGKQNSLIIISPTVGLSKNLFDGGYGNLLGLRVGASVGPAIGMINPYYIEIFEQASGGQQFLFYRVVTTFDPQVHSYDEIFGKANLFSAKVDPSFQLGISLRTFAVWDFVRNNRYISGIQFGLNADMFFKEVPLMADLPGKPGNDKFYLAGSLGIVFGSNRP